MSTNQSSNSYDIKKALGKISDGLKTVAENQDKMMEAKQAGHTQKVAFKPIPLKAPGHAAPSINCPLCNQVILESSLQNGKNTCPKCGRDFKVDLGE